MSTAFRDQLKHWANKAESQQRPVVVWIDPAKHGGMEQAKREARRITVGFGSMVGSERKRIAKLSAKRMDSMPMKTPYENIVCRSVPAFGRLGYEVHFIPQESGILNDLYQELDEDGNVIGSFTDLGRPPIMSNTSEEPRFEARPHDILEALDGVDDIFAVPPKD